MASKWADGFLNLIFPPRCLLCRKRLLPEGEKYSLCLPCKEVFSPAGWFCISCGTSGKEDLSCSCQSGKKVFTALYALAWYEKGWRSIVHRFKYHGRKQIGESLASLMAKGLQSSLKGYSYDFVTAVPLHPKKERERGYNQSFLLATSLGEELGIGCKKTLMRVRNTSSQVGLSGKERRANVSGAFLFKGDSELLKGKKILLVDDVYTTGATMKEAARALMKAGAFKVEGAVAAIQRSRF